DSLRLCRDRRPADLLRRAVALARAAPDAARDRRHRAGGHRAGAGDELPRHRRGPGQRVLRFARRADRHQLPRDRRRRGPAGGNRRGRGVRQRLLRHGRSAARLGRAEDSRRRSHQPAPGERHRGGDRGRGLRHGQPAGADGHLQRRARERAPDVGGGVDDPDLGAHLPRVVRRAGDGRPRGGDRRGHADHDRRTEPELRRARAVRAPPPFHRRRAPAVLGLAAAAELGRAGGARGRTPAAVLRLPARRLFHPGRGDRLGGTGARVSGKRRAAAGEPRLGAQPRLRDGGDRARPVPDALVSAGGGHDVHVHRRLRHGLRRPGFPPLLAERRAGGRRRRRRRFPHRERGDARQRNVQAAGEHGALRHRRLLLRSGGLRHAL
ncbi:MAG: hypothetical protein AVDCRST_MAG89-3545, partial [uncultured Gemmatimonadetes bacterium]